MTNEKIILVENEDPHVFARTCHEKLVEASRDLAWLTQQGIYAAEIVELAHKCEDFQQLLNMPQTSHCKRTLSRFRKLKRELIAGVRRICKVGRRIWYKQPHKQQRYRFPFR